MMRPLFFFLLGVITSCQMSKQAVMTQDGYSEIALGSSVQKVLEEYGEPYSMVHKGNDIYEYEYIEKMLLGREVVLQKRFYLTVKDGKVIDKKVTTSQPPAFEAIYSDDPTRNY